MTVPAAEGQQVQDLQLGEGVERGTVHAHDHEQEGT